MQAKLNKNIKYFVVSGLSHWNFKSVNEFLNNRKGLDIAMHVGHRSGQCMCRIHNIVMGNPGRFKSVYYPCMYINGDIKSVEEVELIAPYEGSVDFTIGSQKRNNCESRHILVGVKLNEDLEKKVNYVKKNIPFEGFECAETEVGDMINILGICNPLFTSRIFFMQEYPKIPDYTSYNEISAQFGDDGESAVFVTDKSGNRFSDYSIDSNYKYHTLLCT